MNGFVSNELIAAVFLSQLKTLRVAGIPLLFTNLLAILAVTPNLRTLEAGQLVRIT